MRFRPCIDLHDGRVKQIVGGTLRDGETPATNFVSEHSPDYFASLYLKDGLSGAHVIMLGKGNEDAAVMALQAAPGFLQIGGGITADNARYWIDRGAAKVIVTSYLFPDDELDVQRLKALHRVVPREKLVIDLSCRPNDSGEYVVATRRWAHLTKSAITAELFSRLDEFCSEYLIHGVSVEGLQGGPDTRLIQLLADSCLNGECTYAGGIRSIEDIESVRRMGDGRIDFTVGSALDIFGGALLKYDDLKTRYASNR